MDCHKWDLSRICLYLFSLVICIQPNIINSKIFKIPFVCVPDQKLLLNDAFDIANSFKVVYCCCCCCCCCLSFKIRVFLVLDLGCRRNIKSHFCLPVGLSLFLSYNVLLFSSFCTYLIIDSCLYQYLLAIDSQNFC